MAPSAAEVTEMRAELRSIEQLIEDLLQQQSKLCSRLPYLKPAGNQRTLAADAAAGAAEVPGSPSSCPSCSSVVKGNRRLSLPLYDPSGTGGGDDIPFTNSPLAELSSESVLSPVPPLERRVDRVGLANRKHSIAKNPTSPMDSLSPPSAPKWPRLSLQRLEPDNLPGSAAAPVTSSPPAQPPAAGLVPPSARASNHPHSAEPGPVLVADMIEQAPNCLIVHLGTNDVMMRQSAKLHYEFESLATTIESLGSQATVATRSVAVGNNTSQFLPLCSSTPQKRRAGRDDGPQAKRSLLECPSLQESDVTSVSADPDDSSYLPSISSLDDTISDQ
ncbi:hypothetical protein ABVT39_021764 [Epinephelus coioides]